MKKRRGCLGGGKAGCGLAVRQMRGWKGMKAVVRGKGAFRGKGGCGWVGLDEW